MCRASGWKPNANTRRKNLTKSLFKIFVRDIPFVVFAPLLTSSTVRPTDIHVCVCVSPFDSHAVLFDTNVMEMGTSRKHLQMERAAVRWRMQANAKCQRINRNKFQITGQINICLSQLDGGASKHFSFYSFSSHFFSVAQSDRRHWRRSDLPKYSCSWLKRKAFVRLFSVVLCAPKHRTQRQVSTKQLSFRSEENPI